MTRPSLHAPPTRRSMDSNQDPKDKGQRPQGAFMLWKTQAIIANYLCLWIILKSYLFLLFIFFKTWKSYYLWTCAILLSDPRTERKK